MYRVRKLNRRSQVPDSRATGHRARIQDFSLALRRLERRQRKADTPVTGWLSELNALAGAPAGSDRHVRALCEGTGGRTVAVVAPLSGRGLAPSLAETLRVLTAMRLVKLLESRGIGPCVTALWHGIPDALDPSGHTLVDRNGEVFRTVPDDFVLDGEKRPHADDSALAVAHLTEHLPDTEFKPWLVKLLETTRHPDPTVWKLRMTFALVAREQSVALAVRQETNWPSYSQSPAQPRSQYRTGLARLLEAYPVLSLVHPAAGDTVSVDAAAGTAFSGEVVPLPAATATVIESKVERWLEKYGLKPEDLMAPRIQLAKLVGELMPAQPAAMVGRTRETALNRLFSLEAQIAELGLSGGQVLDKLANGLDGQFDRLKLSVATHEQEVRENALSQLSKARTYLRPEGQLQAENMSLLHYLAFYGPDFVRGLSESLEIGDMRHHLVYVG
jgi:hypothetical protein